MQIREFLQFWWSHPLEISESQFKANDDLNPLNTESIDLLEPSGKENTFSKENKNIKCDKLCEENNTFGALNKPLISSGKFTNKDITLRKNWDF